MRLNKAYVSGIDEFLAEFDETHTKSASQRAEISKYQRINQLRDNANNKAEDSELWSEF